jgi:hypothetical protein
LNETDICAIAQTGSIESFREVFSGREQVQSAVIIVYLLRIPETPYQSGLIQIRYYFPRILGKVSGYLGDSATPVGSGSTTQRCGG